jgi:hypothetical protein
MTAFLGNLLWHSAIFFFQSSRPFLFAGGLVAGIAVVGAIDSEKYRSTLLKLVLSGVIIGLIPFLIFNFYIIGYFKTLAPLSYVQLLYGALGILVGLFLGLTWLRNISPWFAELSSKLKRSSALERNKKTDVRRIHEFLPQSVGEFDPLGFWDRDKGLFLGLDEFKKPIYMSPSMLGHVQVAGTTGSGKGVFLSMLSAQLAYLGMTLIYVDPKNDEWAPHVLGRACSALKIPFYLLDLRPSAGPQINPFDGDSAEQIEEAFLAAFSLSEKGSDSDFYTISDRQAAGDMAHEMANSQHTPTSLYLQFGEALQERSPKFAGMLREMAEIPAVNAKPGIGLNLREIIKKPGVVYIIGSMRNAKVIRMQRMLLIKIIQLAEERDRTKSNSKIGVVLDEAKYHISRPSIEALGAARDKGVHVVLAHQSLDDLRDCPADLSPDAVVGAVMENCALKLVYKVQDPKTAEWFARKSGKIEVDDEMRKVSRNAALAETVDSDRTIRQAERFLFDENMLLNLNKFQGVLFGHGLPRFIHTSPIRIDKLSSDHMAPQVVEGDRLLKAVEMITPPIDANEKEDPFALSTR